MTRMVQAALADGIVDAEELQAILERAGIDSQLEPAVDLHPAATEDAPQKVLVPEERRDLLELDLTELTYG